MIRALLYIALLAAVAAGIAWLADRPGTVAIEWQGWHIETSLMVVALAVAAIIVAAILLWWILSLLLRSPRLFSGYLAGRRRERGYRALARGLIAVGAGDVRLARRYASEARRLKADTALSRLLEAQAAQLSGDREGARAIFEAMVEDPETRLLGLRGLYIEARREHELAAARHYVEEAARAAPGLPWAGTALAEFQAAEGDYEAALATIERNRDAGIIDRATARRQRAVLLTARAIELEDGSPNEARARALEAHKLAPDLVPAAVVAGRLLTRSGDIRRAAKVVETAWRHSPHPDLADLYAHLRPGDSPRDRLKRVRTLARSRAHHPEGIIAIARAAIDAHEYDEARAVLETIARGQPSERVCLLMAEIEEGETGDRGKVREWLARAVHAPRDPAWTADGVVSPSWAPVSPVTGRLDAFEWKAPTENVALGPVLAADRPPPGEPHRAALLAAGREAPSPATPAAAAAAAAPASAAGQPRPLEEAGPVIAAPGAAAAPAAAAPVVPASSPDATGTGGVAPTPGTAPDSGTTVPSGSKPEFGVKAAGEADAASPPAPEIAPPGKPAPPAAAASEVLVTPPPEPRALDGAEGQEPPFVRFPRPPDDPGPEPGEGVAGPRDERYRFF